MQEPRGTRLPLQIGVQALYSLAIAGGTLVPGAIALVATLFILLVNGGLVVLLVFSQGWLIAVVIIGGEVVLLVRGVKHVRLAVRTRPADLVMDETGLRIEGGRLHGRSVAWAACKAIREESSKADEELAISRAVIELTGGGSLVVAEAADDAELVSLRALCESVEARLHPGQVPALPPEDHPDLLRCPACSAPTAPIDAEQTTCPYCSASVPIPAPLRDRLRAVDEVVAGSRVSAALLARLLAQPSARRATALSVLAGIPIAAAWLLAVFFGYALYRHHGFRAVNVILLSGSAVVTILGCYYLLRYGLVNRMALRVITLDFGALPPAKDGAPWTCRSCRAPLPPARSGLLARCAYCSSDNVQGIDLRPRAEGARTQRATLENAFAHRARDRRSYAIRAAAAVVVLPLSLWAFFGGSRPVTREARFVVACDRGELAACVALGRTYLELDTYDRAAAEHVFEEACARGSLDACGELGGVLVAGDAGELARGLAVLWKACQAERAAACNTLGEAIEARHARADVPAPLALFRRACDGGEIRGCTHVALAMASGAGLPKDEAGAVQLLDTSCRAQDPWACANLARAYFDGRGVPQDLSRAIAMFEHGCAGKTPSWLACAGLGDAYRDGRGVAVNRAKAFDYLRQACEYGSVGAACTRVAESQEAAGELERAYEHYTTACIQGDGPGCLGVASVLVKRGKASKAVGVLRRSCEDDHVAVACATGGVWLEKAKHGLRIDLAQAMALYEAGCRLDDADACDLGGQLADGQHDYPRARRLTGRACELGEARGCNFLGTELELGQGVAIDEAGALAAYQRSCEMTTASNNHAPQAFGCTHQALLARKQGDESRALALLHRACDWQYGVACAWLADGEKDAAAKTALLATACRDGYQEACTAGGTP